MQELEKTRSKLVDSDKLLQSRSSPCSSPGVSLSSPCSSPGVSLEEVVRGLRERLREVEEENSLLQVNTGVAWQDYVCIPILLLLAWLVLLSEFSLSIPMQSKPLYFITVHSYAIFTSVLVLLSSPILSSPL